MPSRDYRILLYDEKENRYFILLEYDEVALEALIHESLPSVFHEDERMLQVVLVLHNEGWKMGVEYVEDATSPDEQYRLYRESKCEEIKGDE